MDGFTLNLLLCCSVILPAGLSIFRFKIVMHNYMSFALLMWLGLFNEILSIVLAYTIRNNTVNSNIYVLAEYAIILSLFYKWDNISIRKYYFLITMGVLVWITDNMIINAINEDNALFRIYYSFVIVLLSIDQVNRIIVYEKRSLVKNASFLICLAFVFYYGFKAFVEVFSAFHLGMGPVFWRNILMILGVANLFSNIIYAIAILCIPSREEFSLQY